VARVVRKKVSDSVLEELVRMFQAGELKAGDKLPNQNALAAQLGVSRASLRESLHTLAIAGVLEQRPGFGTVVRGPLPQDFAELFNLPLISDPKETIELVQARRYIEVANVELAVEHATEGQLAELDRLCREMAAAARRGDQQAYVRGDAAFHHLLARSTGNRFMEHLFLTLRRVMEQFIHESFRVLPRMLDRSLEDHRRICEAVRRRDRRRAVAAMTTHMHHIRTAMKNLYEITRTEPAAAPARRSASG